MGLALFCFLRLSILKQWLYVQNSSSPVGCILPPHLGQVCISHLWILSDPHLRQSLPTRELKLGAASPITPPTTRGTMFLQSGQDMASMCCPMKPRPSYFSVSYPHSWHLNIFFCDINNLLSYQFKTQLALEYFPMEISENKQSFHFYPFLDALWRFFSPISCNTLPSLSSFAKSKMSSSSWRA